MTPETIPPELVDLLDERAGKRHSRQGRVLAALAEILTHYEASLTASRSSPHSADWVAGVRWAAAEADEQATAHNLDVLDITDHLRACADNPGRDSAVDRSEAPACAAVDQTDR